MLYLISAPPRTGKTLKAIEIIFKHLNQGRIVYTNIVGIKIPGVIEFSSGIDDPHDWRDLPNGSVVIYDEAHEHPAFAERNLIKDKDKMAKVRDIGISLTLHGHFGFDIYLITQNPRLLCAEVLASVGTHYIMRRKFGFDMATIFEYAEAKTTFSKATAKDALNTTFWRYPKHLYKFYVSSEQHNIKKTFPLKYVALLLIPLALFYKGYLNSQETSFFGLFGDKQESEQVKQVEKVEQNAEQVTPMMTEQQVKQQIEYLCNQPENKNAVECGGTGYPAPPSNFQQSQQVQGVNYTQTVKYDIDKPYDFDKSQVQYTVTERPVLTGCMQDDKQCKCYTQQATIVNLSIQECKRYLSGDKPFNYFKSSSYNGSFGETK